MPVFSFSLYFFPYRVVYSRTFRAEARLQQHAAIKCKHRANTVAGMGAKGFPTTTSSTAASVLPDFPFQAELLDHAFDKLPLIPSIRPATDH